MKFYVIPNLKEIDKWNELSKNFNLGYEYNDFFTPSLLDDEDKLNKIIDKYKVFNRENDTLHGVFFDINFASIDSKIKDISIKRAKKSLMIASKLNCKAVIFHTNYQTWIKNTNYKQSWVQNSALVYKELLDEFSNINIYVENMFDDEPYLLKELADSLKDEKRFGVCLDVAHAHLSKTPMNIWFDELMPYVKHIHINDNNKDEDSHLPLSMGNIDYKYIFKKINEMNDVTVLLEMNKYEDVIKSLNVIKDVNL